MTAMAAIGAIRDNAQTIQNQINNLEQDSLSNDPNLNTEISVLNKINAANVLTLRTLQDSNKLLLSLLEQNVSPPSNSGKQPPTPSTPTSPDKRRWQAIWHRSPAR